MTPMDSTTTRALHCVVVTPERAVLDQTVDFVALPMYDGELRVRRGAETQRFFVDSGFAQVRANVVTVLTPRAIRAEDIDPAAAARALEAAKAPATTPEEQAAQLKAQQRARAQMRLARRPGAEHHA